MFDFYVFVYSMRMRMQGPSEARSIRSPRAGVASSCELPSMGAGEEMRFPPEAVRAVNLWASPHAISPGFISKVSTTVKT